MDEAQRQWKIYVLFDVPHATRHTIEHSLIEYRIGMTCSTVNNPMNREKGAKILLFIRFNDLIFIRWIIHLNKHSTLKRFVLLFLFSKINVNNNNRRYIKLYIKNGIEKSILRAF